MAGKANNHSGERSRVRFVMVDFDGSSADLQQLAQTFAQAVKAPSPVVVAIPAPMPPNGTAPALGTSAQQNGHGPGLFDAVISPEPALEAEYEPAAPKPSGGVRKKLRTPVNVSDLEFTSGARPFKEYMDEISPKDHSKRYLAITHWLREYRGIAETGADHVYTCYRFLNMNVPRDVLSVFRALKAQGWVEQGSKPGLFKITHVGENQLILAKGKE